MKKLLAPLLLVAATGCSQDSAVSIEPDPVTGRWYSSEQVVAGKRLFSQYCASCHGKSAEATPDWKKTLADGSYPPPPLNGSAHAWHHPLAMLERIILKGGASYGGQMPAWEGTLTDQQVLEVIASFQSYWSDEIYNHWLERERQSRKR